MHLISSSCTFGRRVVRLDAPREKSDHSLPLHGAQHNAVFGPHPLGVRPAAPHRLVHVEVLSEVVLCKDYWLEVRRIVQLKIRHVVKPERYDRIHCCANQNHDDPLALMWQSPETG